MTRRRGFVLLTVLWVIVLLAGLGASVLAETSVAVRAAGNRVELSKAEWARAACWEWVRDARAANELRVDSLDVGSSAWCSAAVDDLGRYLNVNRVPRSLVQCLLGDRGETFASALPIENDRALATLLISIGRPDMIPALTTRGSGSVNVNLAPEAVLACLPGVGRQGAPRLAGARRMRGAFGSIDAFLAALPPDGRATLTAALPDLLPVLAVYSKEYLLTVVGHAGARGTRAAMRLELLKQDAGFAVNHREVE